jgi:hypothetical protein
MSEENNGGGCGLLLLVLALVILWGRGCDQAGRLEKLEERVKKLEERRS